MTTEEKLELLKRSGITVMGDLVLEKHVEHEIGVVEAGGIGIQIVQGRTAASPKEPSSSASSGGRTSAASSKTQGGNAKPTTVKRELMTFRKNGLTEAHLKVLNFQLVSEGWIEGQEPDFLALFGGEPDACTLVWRGAFGKGTLRGLFRQMAAQGLIIVPDGFSLDHILEGHFTDTQGHFLSGLNSSGEEPAPKALPFLHRCLQLLTTDFSRLDRSELVEMMGAREVNDENRSRRR